MKPLRNHKLLIAYDGTLFAGWQIQGKKPTVQGHLEQVLARCWGHHVTLYGSGRTDAGVHAHGQVAHFRAEPKFRDLSSLQSALNFYLPREIRILQAKYTPETFHSRFSAKGKEYRYRIGQGPFLDPFEINRAWHVPRKLDIDAMGKAGQLFVGTHDFASFTSNPGYKRETTVRSIRSVRFQRQGAILAICFRGEGFLYRMVRNLVGALVKVGHGRITQQELKKILEAQRRSAAPYTAPACGLYLEKVFYTDRYV